MRLSEAIRLGSTMIKENTVSWFINRPDNSCACALGTAWYAATNGKKISMQAHPANQCPIPKEIINTFSARPLSPTRCINALNSSTSKQYWV